MCIESISVYPKCVDIQLGKWYYNAYAVVSPADSVCSSVIWSSSNPNVAAVNESNGYIYGVSKGTAIITATATDGSGICDCMTVNVDDTVYVNRILLDKSNLRIQNGFSYELSATVEPENATNKTLSWISGNPSVATVDNGIVSGLSVGRVFITASSTDGSDISANCRIEVTDDILIRELIVHPCCTTLEVGQDKKFYATIYPGIVTNDNVEWSSSDESIAIVNPTSGKVTAVSPGEVRIYARSTDGGGAENYCSLTVEGAIPVESISMAATYTVKIGERDYIRGTTVLPRNATNKNIRWSSSDPYVAEIDSTSGVITPVSIGRTEIRATSRENEQIYSDCLVTSQDTYIYELINTFGFSEHVAELIRVLYDKVDIIFENESVLERAWKCARLLGGIVYGNDYSGSKQKLKWQDVAGRVFTTTEEEYFTEILKYSLSDYEQLKTSIKDNYENSVDTDFAHMQISLAARLAYKLDIDGIFSNIGTISSDENVSYLAGWLGDATLLGDDGKTSMPNGDYCADLDAENIYRYISEGETSVNAINLYYSELASICNRAQKFLSYISYDTVQYKVFYELIDKKLLSLISAASQEHDVSLVNHYFELMENEQYHWDTIKTNYPDTYNFLKSINDELPNIENYII